MPGVSFSLPPKSPIEKEDMMIQDHLKAATAILLLTQEPHRAENLLPCEGWNFLSWDCLRGFRQAGKPQVIDEIRDPDGSRQPARSVQDTSCSPTTSPFP
jgi:hypothetical protein